MRVIHAEDVLEANVVVAAANLHLSTLRLPQVLGIDDTRLIVPVILIPVITFIVWAGFSSTQVCTSNIRPGTVVFYIYTQAVIYCCMTFPCVCVLCNLRPTWPAMCYLLPLNCMHVSDRAALCFFQDNEDFFDTYDQVCMLLCSLICCSCFLSAMQSSCLVCAKHVPPSETKLSLLQWRACLLVQAFNHL